MKILYPLIIPLLYLCAPLQAEVTLDGTLGRSGALPGPDYQIGADLGQQHGGNLFHSFQEFSLNSTESATFSGPNSVQNVINRVTGGNPSNIDGLLRSTIPNADMYFLNPYGIMFGPNAKLDVQGSFHASTADTLRFGDGNEFNARQPSNSVLTVAPIEAFGFISGSPESLSIDGSQLSVPTGKTLSILGGNLNIFNQAALLAPSGRINLASVAKQGDIIPKFEDLVTPEPLGKLTIQGDSQISTSGEGGGAIYIRGEEFFSENSMIKTQTDGTNDFGIDVQASQLTLNDTRLVSETYGAGQGGNITIRVSGPVNLLGEKSSGDDFTNPENELISLRTYGEGASGSLDLEAERLDISGARQIGTMTLGKGKGGDVNIKVPGGDIILSRDEKLQGYVSMIVTQAHWDATNQAGNLVLEARNLILKDGTQITSSTFGAGNSGNLTIKVDDLISLSGTDQGIRPDGSVVVQGCRISSGAYAGGYGPVEEAGDGGNIYLKTRQLSLADKAKIDSDTLFMDGQGGNVEINVHHLNMTGESTISATSRFGATGDAGAVELNVGDTLRLEDGSSIKTTAEQAVGGNININSPVYLYLSDDSEISSSVTKGKGRGGDITLTPKLIILDNSKIWAQADENYGGEITIDSKGVYIMANGLSQNPNDKILYEDSSTRAKSERTNYIDASSNIEGLDGVVIINSPEETPEEGVVNVPPPFLLDNFSGNRCEGLTRKDLSSLILIGREALPTAPGDLKTQAHIPQD